MHCPRIYPLEETPRQVSRGIQEMQDLSQWHLRRAVEKFWASAFLTQHGRHAETAPSPYRCRHPHVGMDAWPRHPRASARMISTNPWRPCVTVSTPSSKTRSHRWKRRVLCQTGPCQTLQDQRAPAPTTSLAPDESEGGFSASG